MPAAPFKVERKMSWRTSAPTSLTGSRNNVNLLISLKSLLNFLVEHILSHYVLMRIVNVELNPIVPSLPYVGMSVLRVELSLFCYVTTYLQVFQSMAPLSAAFHTESNLLYQSAEVH